MSKTTKTNPSFSLTEEEVVDLNNISKEVLGKKNMTGIIRYWINNHKNKR